MMKTASQIIEAAYWKTKGRKDDSMILRLTISDIIRLMEDYKQAIYG